MTTKLKSNIDELRKIIGEDNFKTDEAIEKIMPQNPSEREIKKIAAHQGILSMRQDGIIKMLNGITSYDEVKSVVDLLEE